MYPLILKFYLKIDKMQLKNASEKDSRNTLDPHCPFGEGIFVYGVKQKLYNVLGGLRLL